MDTPHILEDVHSEAEDFLRKYCPTPTKAIDNIADITNGSASPKYRIARRLAEGKACSYFVAWKKDPTNFGHTGSPIWSYDVKFAMEFPDNDLLRGHLLVLRHMGEPCYSARANA